MAKGKADYERIVEWLVPDTRDEYGHVERTRRRDGRRVGRVAVQEPAVVPDDDRPGRRWSPNGQFNGQRTSYWVNAGEETILRVEKALSVRTRATENEQLHEGRRRPRPGLDRRPAVPQDDGGGRTGGEQPPQGDDSAGDPPPVLRRTDLGGRATRSAAPRGGRVLGEQAATKCCGTSPLKGGEEKKLKYSYTVLVPH